MFKYTVVYALCCIVIRQIFTGQSYNVKDDDKAMLIDDTYNILLPIITQHNDRITAITYYHDKVHIDKAIEDLRFNITTRLYHNSVNKYNNNNFIIFPFYNGETWQLIMFFRNNDSAPYAIIYINSNENDIVNATIINIIKNICNVLKIDIRQSAIHRFKPIFHATKFGNIHDLYMVYCLYMLHTHLYDNIQDIFNMLGEFSNYGICELFRYILPDIIRDHDTQMDYQYRNKYIKYKNKYNILKKYKFKRN